MWLLCFKQFEPDSKITQVEMEACLYICSNDSHYIHGVKYISNIEPSAVRNAVLLCGFKIKASSNTRIALQEQVLQGLDMSSIKKQMDCKVLMFLKMNKTKAHKSIF